MALHFTQRTRIVFLGDDITEAGRNDDAEDIGFGYVRIIRDFIRVQHPATAPVVLNRGVRGQRVADFAANVRADIGAGKPDIVSILIGLNDLPHDDATEVTPPDRFHTLYRETLAQLTDAAPDCRIILCDPMASQRLQPLKLNRPLQPYILAINDLAKEFKATAVVPLHGAFVYSYESRPDLPWITERGRPSSTGQMLIAYTWMEIAEWVKRSYT